MEVVTLMWLFIVALLAKMCVVLHRLFPIVLVALIRSPPTVSGMALFICTVLFVALLSFLSAEIFVAYVTNLLLLLTSELLMPLFKSLSLGISSFACGLFLVLIQNRHL